MAEAIAPTIDYGVWLCGWALLSSLVFSLPALVHWRFWRRSAAGAFQRYHLANTHYLALAVLPILSTSIVHWRLNGSVRVAAEPFHAIEAGSPSSPVVAASVRIVVLFWIVGTLAMVLRLATDWYRANAVAFAGMPAELSAAVSQLAQAVDLRCRLRVFEGNVTSPQTIGVFRPILIVPRNFAHCMRRAERDAILLHELAHMRNHDYGWNLVQRGVLAFLWFNPLAWTLYAHLCREREERCDTLAIVYGAKSSDLARALVHLAATVQGEKRIVTMASSSGSLRMRLLRLFDPSAMRPDAPETTPMIMLALSTCVAAFGVGQTALVNPAMQSAYAASVFGPTTSILAHDPAGPFRLEIRHGIIIGAWIGKQAVAADRIIQHAGEVTLLNESEKPALRLRVLTDNSIRWAPRH